jgi:myo-inositol-1(or 4)-monophosphatase
VTLHEKARLAAQVAREAGAMLLGSRDFKVTRKAAHDYVTEIDIACEKLIREKLLAACPEDGFYGEEGGGAEKAEGRWIVDPIDGTTNFIKDIPLYTISIAYEARGELVIGCVYAPALDEMYLAIQGEGATRNGEAIRVSEVSDPETAVYGMSFAHRLQGSHDEMMGVLDRICGRVNDLRRMGSAAFDLCCVACGRTEGFFELGLHLYDIAAGVVILREAGGMVTGWAADEDVLQTGNICATNGHTHAFLQGILRG